MALDCTLVQVPVEVTDADEVAEADAQHGFKQVPHRYQLAGGKSGAESKLSRGMSSMRSSGSMVGRQTSRRHHRTADDRRWVPRLRECVGGGRGSPAHPALPWWPWCTGCRVVWPTQVSDQCPAVCMPSAGKLPCAWQARAGPTQ